MKKLLLLTLSIFLSLPVFAQETKISLRMENQPIRSILKEIETKSDYTFVYSSSLINVNQTITLIAENESLAGVVQKMCNQANLSYSIEGKRILLNKLEPANSGASQGTSQQARTQNRITGTVTSSEDGKAVPFATIAVKGSNMITNTDVDGKYVFPNVPDNAVLVISCIGFTSQEISVNNRSVVNILLFPVATSLDEAVVVAYGTMKRKDITASIASLKGDELIKVPVASMDQAMQGKMPGVQISASSGSPGAEVITRIRGAASISAGNDPLYVVDGVPLSSNIESTSISFGGGYISALTSINPGDIENIQVLKDASAASLYGSRASNGVVLITTKAGKAQKAKISLDAYYGVQNLRKKLEFLGTTEWITAQNEARDNYNKQYGYLDGNSRFQRPIAPAVPNTDVDWVDEITRNAPPISNLQVSVNGGSEATQFFLSASGFKQSGLIHTDDYTRYTFRSKVDHRFSKRIKIGLNATYTWYDNQRVTNDNSTYGLFLNATRLRPDVPVYDPNNAEEYYLTTIANPVACYKEAEQHTFVNRTSGNFRFSYEFIDHLTFRSTLGAEFTSIRELSFRGLKNPQSRATGMTNDNNTYLFDCVIDNTLTYANTFGPVNLTVMTGQSFNLHEISRINAQGQGFISDDLLWIESASTKTVSGGSFRSNALEAYFGRLNLNIADRYIIEGSLRADASSKFSPKNRWGVFPAGSIGWRISSESFFPKNNLLTDAKVRASLGLTGNSAGIGNYAYMMLYTSSNIRYLGQAGVQPATTSPNPDLRWEQTLQTDIGVDLAFMKNRIEFTYDFWKKDTRDLLLSRAIPITTGWSSVTQNVGRMQNTGHEFSLFSRNVVKKQFQWNTSFNISFTKSIVKELAKNELGLPVELSTGTKSRIVEGKPVSYWLIKSIGIYQSNDQVPASLYARGIRAGDVIYEDFNGDGIITSADRQLLDCPSMPTMFGGLNNNLYYHGFDLALNLQWVYGGYVYAYWKDGDKGGNGGYSLNAIFKPFYDKRWTPENSHNDYRYPRFVYGSEAGSHNTLASSDRWLSDASYLRIKSLVLGYSVPAQVTRKIGIDNLRFYISAENLWTFTKYDGYDPELSYNWGDGLEQGLDFASVPLLRTFSFGINITF